jgi:hypothetical protein
MKTGEKNSPTVALVLSICREAANGTDLAPGIGGGITAGKSPAKSTLHKTDLKV